MIETIINHDHKTRQDLNDMLQTVFDDHLSYLFWLTQDTVKGGIIGHWDQIES